MRNKILYAEDKENVRKAFGMLLKSAFPELDLESFEDGTSLEERLKGNIEGVKLVITDNDMPGINGCQIIMNYAQKKEFAQMPFILFYGGDPFLGKALVKNYGAFAYVMKGTDPTELTSKIREALDYSESIKSSQ